MNKTTITPTKQALLVLFVAGMSFLSFGQDKKQMREDRSDKVKSLKIGYFTEELKLSTSESEKFWPIYNEMEEKLKHIHKENKKIIDQLNENADNLKDDDFKKNMNLIFESEIQEVNIKKEYISKIASAISYKKASKMMKLEKEFKTMLLKEMKGKGKEKGHRPPPPHQE